MGCLKCAGYRPKRCKTTCRAIGNREGERSYGKSGSGVQVDSGGPGVHPNQGGGLASRKVARGSEMRGRPEGTGEGDER